MTDKIENQRDGVAFATYIRSEFANEKESRDKTLRALNKIVITWVALGLLTVVGEIFGFALHSIWGMLIGVIIALLDISMIFITAYFIRRCIDSCNKLDRLLKNYTELVRDYL